MMDETAEWAESSRAALTSEALRLRLATMAANLAEACKALETAARHAYVVCGQPATQEGFERAWATECKADYDQWVRLTQGAKL